MAVKRIRFVLGALAGVGAAYWVISRRLRQPIDPTTLIVAPSGTDDWRQRFLTLPTSINLRDIGGYPTADGKRVRAGLVYRAGSLAELSAADQQALAGLGLCSIIDLRTPKELEDYPDALPHALRSTWAHVPVYVENNSSEFIKRLVLYRGRIDRALADGYRELIDRRAHVFGDLLNRMARPGGLPVLLHCTAGKDRTGIIVALLLMALGVSEADVVADYSLTNHHADEIRRSSDHDMRRIKRFGFSEAAIQPLVIADPENMRLMLAHIRRVYGGIEPYLVNKAGVSEGNLRALRETLLEPVA